MKQSAPDISSDCVGLPNRQLWIDGNVHFDVQTMAQPACSNFGNRAAPVGMPWMWTLAFGYHEDRTPTHGYAATREAAMAAFAKSWRRE
jgi:hypothetical protein